MKIYRKTNKEYAHLFIGILLCVSSVFLVLSIVTYTYALELTASVTIANSAPEIVHGPIVSRERGGIERYSSGEISDLIVGGEKYIYVEGIVEDLNGQGDISEVHAILHKNTLTNSCSETGQKCIKNLGCLLSPLMDTERMAFSCKMVLPYFMDATDDHAGDEAGEHWIISVIAFDKKGALDIDQTREIEVRSLVGLNIPENISFGRRSMNTQTTSADNVSQVITKGGYVRQDFRVRMLGEGFTCSISELGIPRENMRWANTDIGYDDNGVSSMTEEFIDTDFGIEKRTHATGVTKPFYWNISIPYGVQGTCTASLDILAKNANLP